MKPILLTLALAAVGCEEDHPQAPAECTIEWRQMVEDRLNVLERGMSDLESWRWQRDGGLSQPR